MQALQYYQRTWPEGKPMPAVAALDAIFQRYGWDYWTYMAQPESLIEELMVVLAAEGLAAKIKERRDAGHTGGNASVPTAENFSSAARSAGLPMPPSESGQVDDPLFPADPGEQRGFDGWSPASGPHPDD